MAFGVKVTETVQGAPAATVPSHVLLSVKSAASVPWTLMPEMLKAVLPVFVKVVDNVVLEPTG